MERDLIWEEMEKGNWKMEIGNGMRALYKKTNVRI